MSDLEFVCRNCRKSFETASDGLFEIKDGHGGDGGLGPFPFAFKEKQKTTGLSLQEAIKSGKRFRRPSWNKGVLDRFENQMSTRVFYEAEILAIDYELEPEPEQKIELTRSKVLSAFFNWAPEHSQLEARAPMFLKELGFDDDEERSK